MMAQSKSTHRKNLNSQWVGSCDCYDDEKEQDHECEQYFGKVVDLKVDGANPGSWFLQAHVGPYFSSCVDHHPVDVSLRGKEGVLPHVVVGAEGLFFVDITWADAICFEIVDLFAGWLADDLSSRC